MGKARRFSKKQLNDRRFRRTEDAILKAYFAVVPKGKGPQELAKRAGISRATLHRHHGTIFAIKSNYEKYLLHEYRILMRKRKDAPVSVEKLFSTTLIFMTMHKKIFVPILKDGAESLVREMIRVLEPKFASRGICVTGKGFEVYVGEVYVILKQWSECNFADSEFRPVLNNLVYLTKTIRQRLEALK